MAARKRYSDQHWSLSRLASALGVTRVTTSMNARKGYWTPDAVRQVDGVWLVVDPERAIREWEAGHGGVRSSRKGRTPVVPLPSSSPGAPDTADAADVEDPEEEGEDGEAPPVQSAPTLLEAQRLLALQRERKLRLENDAREGLLINADLVAREAFTAARVIREAMLNLPTRLAPELAARFETSSTEIFVLIDRAIREALQSTAGVIETLTPEDRPEDPPQASTRP